MDNFAGIIKFKEYVVDFVKFKNNPNFEGEEVSLQFEPSVDFRIEENNMLVALTIDIFKEAVKYNYPFEMSVKVIGFFQTLSENHIESYKANAVAILFPYVRSIISTYTAVANVNPLILPTVNINKMLKKNS